VAARAERVISKVRQVEGDVLLFSHGHFLRVFAACWIGLDPAAARTLYLGTGALSILGYEHGRDDPVIRLWNDRRHALGGA
jgi:broad specificity phosphatase PhoE